jgi:quercetin dioxygenase-like cupin family protein
MIIKDLLKQLETSENPVAKAIHKGTNFKVLAIAFKKGMHLKAHKTNLTTKLTVLSGVVIYKQDEISKELSQFDETDIPIGILHEVECLEDALCLLTQG